MKIPSFRAICPECKVTVSAFLGHGSLENLKKGEGEIRLAHLTNNPSEGDHTWILNDPEAKKNLHKFIAQYNADYSKDRLQNGRT